MMASSNTTPSSGQVPGPDEGERPSTISESGRNAGGESAPPLHLVTMADEAFAMPMSVALFSVLQPLPPGSEPRIVALDAGVSGKSRERVHRVVDRASQTAQLEWVCPDTSAIDDVDHARSSKANLYLFLVPEILPDECTRALYIDSDLVAERSVRSLWTKSFGDNAVLAVPERTVSCPSNGVAEWERLGFDADDLYFNSGVMLLNLEVWRQQNVHGRAIDYLLDPENRFCYKSDQEALNAVLEGQWGPLDPRWNAIHLLYEPDHRAEIEEMMDTDLRFARDDPYLIHYTGDEKPWHRGCEHPRRRRFYHYLWQSGWFTTAEYAKWRAPLVYQWLKDVSRPYRHRIGLRR